MSLVTYKLSTTHDSENEYVMQIGIGMYLCDNFSEKFGKPRKVGFGNKVTEKSVCGRYGNV